MNDAVGVLGYLRRLFRRPVRGCLIDDSVAWQPAVKALRRRTRPSCPAAADLRLVGERSSGSAALPVIRIRSQIDRPAGRPAHLFANLEVWLQVGAAQWGRCLGSAPGD